MRIDTISSSSVYKQTRETNKTEKQQLSPSEEENKAQNLPPHDEYISSAENPEKPSGLYKMGTDADGKPKIIYDDPKTRTADKSQETESTTVDTGNVDREIDKLKESKKQLMQQIKSAGQDDKKRSELEAKLAGIEKQIMQKDNDTYRKQNSTVS